MNTCYIAGSGDFTLKNLSPENGDFVIAADGGYRYLTDHGIKVNLLCGDFDSFVCASLPEGIPVLRFPCEKDDTDVGLALKEGMARGYRKFRLYGCSGSRPDHFFANLQHLKKLSEAGCDIALVCPGFSVYAVTNSERTFVREKGTVLSVFAVCEKAEGVSLENVKYPLNNESVLPEFPIGVSNEFLIGEARIRVKNGTLLIFVYDSPQNN